MEIFIVEVDRVWNGQIMEYDTKAYSTEEKAKKALKEFVMTTKSIANVTDGLLTVMTTIISLLTRKEIICSITWKLP